MFFPDIYIEPPPEYAERVENPVWFYDDPESPFFSIPSEENYGLNWRPIDFEIEAVSISGCHICITFNYTVGFVRFPSSTICYIKPECQNQQDELPHEPAPIECNNDDIDFSILENSNSGQGISPYCPPPAPPNEPLGRPGEILIFEQYRMSEGQSVAIITVNDGAGVPQSSNFNNPLVLIQRRRINAPYIPRLQSMGSNTSFSSGGHRDPMNFSSERNNSYYTGTFDFSIGWTWSDTTSAGIRGFIQTFGQSGINTFRKVTTDYASKSVNQSYTIVKTEGGQQLWPPLPPIPPQPPNNEDNPMDCCEEVLRRLRQIQDDLVILMRWTGAKPGVMQVPKSFMNKEGLTNNFIEGLIGLFDNNQLTIESLPQFLEWFVERQQEWMGEWPVKVSDSQGNELGSANLAISNQTVLSKLVAEGELNQLSNAALSKILLEVALTRQSNALVSSQLETIISFLNISTSEKTLEMKHGFTLPSDEQVNLESIDTVQEFEQFLQNSTRSIKIVDLANSDNDLADLRFKVDKILALLSKNIITADDTRQNIISKLRDNPGGNESTNLPTNWIDQLERQNGEITPWGDTVDERPQLDTR